MTIPETAVLYYVADPMCSWCWGFREARDEILEALPTNMKVEYVMGGLARDSDEPMTEETKSYVQGAWRSVSAETGAEFNWDFWTLCKPRRSTYPACRAVIVAGEKGPEMFDLIQEAYYLEARNPSDLDVLCSLAVELGLDGDRFLVDIASPEVETMMQEGFNTRRRIGVTSFPSLVLEAEGDIRFLCEGYSLSQDVLARLD